MSKISTYLIMAVVATGVSNCVSAAVSVDEAKKLGTSLTVVGADRTGNPENTIPEYTGGLVSVPASFKKKPDAHPNPFVDEKPLFSITSKNLAQYESKLTVATKELLTRNPTFRIDVYPTHRTAAFPKYVTENTIKNASSAKSTNGGLSIEGAYAGYPFPIPKTGFEAMWNHLLRFQGHSMRLKYDSLNVDSSGKATLATTGDLVIDYPIYDPKKTGFLAPEEFYNRIKVVYTEPARRSGEALIIMDAVDPVTNPRRAWQYLPGQRRVKLAPDVSYDTPNPGAAGQSTYDDIFVFSGAMDRYDFKLVGKKEIYIPYNTYAIGYMQKSDPIVQPKHMNPDFLRWELHRVWVVEATLKPGKRHIYSKRVFYLDEDSWIALSSDQYDGKGQLFRAAFCFISPQFDLPAPTIMGNVVYDFATGGYNLSGANFGSYGGFKYVPALPQNEWAPEALSGSGVR